MSLVNKGRSIICDNENCGAVTTIPVALRPSQGRAAGRVNVAEGWLFIVNQLRPLHFCPECGRRYLAGCYEWDQAARQS
jgi:hypothetical protein